MIEQKESLEFVKKVQNFLSKKPELLIQALKKVTIRDKKINRNRKMKISKRNKK